MHLHTCAHTPRTLLKDWPTLVKWTFQSPSGYSIGVLLHNTCTAHGGPVTQYNLCNLLLKPCVIYFKVINPNLQGRHNNYVTLRAFKCLGLCRILSPRLTFSHSILIMCLGVPPSTGCCVHQCAHFSPFPSLPCSSEEPLCQTLGAG